MIRSTGRENRKTQMMDLNMKETGKMAICTVRVPTTSSRVARILGALRMVAGMGRAPTSCMLMEERVQVTGLMISLLKGDWRLDE